MKIIRKQKLKNGLNVTFEDLSRTIAGDRWFVQLRCLAEIDLQDWMIDSLSGDTQRKTYILEQFDGKLSYEIIKEINFVDQEMKDDAIADLEGRFLSLIEFMEREKFIIKLFEIKVSELKERFASIARSNIEQSCEEDSEPADFSACFR